MIPEKLTFTPLSRRQIEADFSGDHITSNAGLLLLREVDKQHRLTQRLASVLNDPRNPELVRHKLETMTRQRVFGVIAGYEDLNDQFSGTLISDGYAACARYAEAQKDITHAQ